MKNLILIVLVFTIVSFGNDSLRYVNVNSVTDGNGTTTALTGANAAFANCSTAIFNIPSMNTAWIITCHAALTDTDRKTLTIPALTGASYINYIKFVSDDDSLKYNIKKSGTVITNNSRWFKLNGFRIINGDQDKGVYINAGSGTGDYIEIKNCEFFGVPNGSSACPIYSYGSEDTVNLINSIIINTNGTPSSDVGMLNYAVAGTVASVYNCTFINFGYPIYRSAGEVSATNLGTYRCPRIRNVSTITLTTCDSINIPKFVDSTNRNYRLAFGDTIWGGKGTDKSSLFTKDIDNKTISSWMIGASFPPSESTNPPCDSNLSTPITVDTFCDAIIAEDTLLCDTGMIIFEYDTLLNFSTSHRDTALHKVSTCVYKCTTAVQKPSDSIPYRFIFIADTGSGRDTTATIVAMTRDSSDTSEYWFYHGVYLCTLTVSTTTGGTTNPSGAQSDTCGDSLRIVALPSPGYAFAYWSRSSTKVHVTDSLNDTTYCNKADSTNGTVTAHFGAIPLIDSISKTYGKWNILDTLFGIRFKTTGLNVKLNNKTCTVIYQDDTLVSFRIPYGKGQYPFIIKNSDSLSDTSIQKFKYKPINIFGF